MSIFFIISISFLFSLMSFYFESMMFFFLFIYLILMKGMMVNNFLFFINYFSWPLLLLSATICSLMIIANLSFLFSIKEMNFMVYIMIMMISLFLTFTSKSLMLFYIFFEFSIIPIFMMISSMGSNPERLESAIYMFFYTLTFSLPFLIHMLRMESSLKNLSIFLFNFFYYLDVSMFFVFISIFMFFVKVPSFFFHLWLPKAHVEAPVSGSMILAGVLLKLGTYGLFVYLPSIFFHMMPFLDFFFMWGIWGALVASFICFRQVDMKKMIAYMSIMHMGMIISSIFSMLEFSFTGTFFMMISHGLTSSIMFYSLNCFYERMFSRSLMLIRGGVILVPSLFFWVSLSCASNIGVPPSISFFSELMLIFSIMEFSMNSWIFLFPLIFMSSIITFYFLTSLFHGFMLNKSIMPLLSVKENLIHFSHLFPIFLLFMFL